MHKRLIITLLGIVLLCQAVFASAQPRHQLRLGWGDPLFETMAFHEGASPTGDFVRQHDFCYTGHFFAEYQYSVTPVISLGLQTDLEGIFWTETLTDRYRKFIGPSSFSHNYDLSILPTIRFTFLNTPWVQLYAGSAIGLMMAFDNARHLELAPVFSTTLLGVQVGKGPWSGSLELGGLSSMLNANKVYMLGSRLVSVSVNYRW
jgi:hypothetical protein